MGNLLLKQKKTQSVVKLHCPYCNKFQSYLIKKYDKHILSCINFKKELTDQNIIFYPDISQKRWPNRRVAMSNLTGFV